MEPYNNLDAHLRDIIQLAETPEQASLLTETILARENTDFFLPVAHLRRLYQPNAEHFYLAVGLMLKGVNLFKQAEAWQYQTLRDDIDELLESDGRFKRRVVRFIYTPDAALSRPWLTYQPLSDDFSVVPNTEIAALTALTRSFMAENQPHAIIITGAYGSGRRTTALCACPMPLMFIDTRHLSENPEAIIEEAVLESKLMGCVLCFSYADTLFLDSRLMSLLLRLIAPVSRVVYFIAEAAPDSLDMEDFRLAKIAVSLPAPPLSRALWQHFSATVSFASTPDFDVLSEDYRFTPLQIKHCVAQAKNAALMRGEETVLLSDLLEACRQQDIPAAMKLGHAVRPAFQWEDLILPEDVKAQLEEAAARVRNAGKVYDDWGFGAKTPYGRGVAVLLEGPSGTGKTMAAHALAAKTGLPLYIADMASLMSKYIGETEKNLKTLFEETAETECVLFFDEADAIFSKRTEITDARDRYSNLEVSFLLQKLEERRGLTVLATNLPRNFDDAFKRRLQYILRIPFPDAALRKRIWRSVFAGPAPLAEDIDFDYLAARYELNGGSIKSIALAAAFSAAKAHEKINMQRVMDALRAETSKSGITHY